MYTGVYNRDNHNLRILILGESHHYETPSTQKTVDGYLEKCRKDGHAEGCHRFFEQIVRAFGKIPETEREEFWCNVRFGNYIDEICGVGDSQATDLLAKEENRIRYNDDLFDFVDAKEIDIIFCFSRRVYNNLPSFAAGEKEETINVGDFLRTKDGKPKKDYISYCKYLPGPHKHTGKPLERTVEVFGMLHPSGRYGFAPENYAPELKKRIEF